MTEGCEPFRVMLIVCESPLEAAGGAPPPPPGEGGAGEQAAKLAELQKQIINATWKLQRTASPPAADIGVVRNSQTDALGQATEAAAEGSSDARVAAGWKTAQEAMKQAGEELEAVEKQPAPLTAALAAEQKAYQALLAVRAREIRISRSRSPGQPASASEQQRQMEMDEMDLTKEENRYQMESEAQAPQEAAQREQRQVLNRLQELARRQAARGGVEVFRMFGEGAAVACGSGFDANPSPGNIRDGLITDAIKSAGAATKGRGACTAIRGG